MIVSATKWLGNRYKISINNSESKRYWIEKNKKFTIHNAESSISGFATIEAAVEFIEMILGISVICYSCMRGIHKDDISLWEDYATGRMYKVCPKCNNIFGKQK